MRVHHLIYSERADDRSEDIRDANVASALLLNLALAVGFGRGYGPRGYRLSAVNVETRTAQARIEQVTREREDCFAGGHAVSNCGKEGIIRAVYPRCDKEVGDLGSIVELTLNAQRKSFEALNQLERVLRRKAWAEVAQKRGASA
jgi:hypothetical protein